MLEAAVECSDLKSDDEKGAVPCSHIRGGDRQTALDSAHNVCQLQESMRGRWAGTGTWSLSTALAYSGT